MSGLSGIPAIRPLDATGDITVIRPLLWLTSSEILSYCKEEQLVYYIDASNVSPVYLRNRVRHELIPLLEQDYNPRVVQALSNTAELVQDDEDYISCKVREKLGENSGRCISSRCHYEYTCFMQTAHSDSEENY